LFSIAVPKSFEPTSFGPSRVPTDVDVRVYNVRGQLVRTLSTSKELAAAMTLRWDGTTADGSPVPSGVYFLRVRAGDDEAVRKIVLMR
jgi:flagellar hook assembly protein FlgD